MYTRILKYIFLICRRNPEIPLEIRPVVYCTMAREGDEEVRAALRRRLEQETSRYERLVILESFACSEDAAFIDG